MSAGEIALWGAGVAVVAVIVRDLSQTRNAVNRNFPLVGHLRALFSELGPPLRQYFFASDTEERPYNRITREWVYASAAGTSNAIAFGSQVDHNAPGRLHILPSLYPTLASKTGPLPVPRVIGASRPEPYQPNHFVNISGMSFGALSPNAVRALSRGARLAGMYMGTGEGSISPYHVEGGGDILFQIGPAKFGCRTPEGRFDDEKARQILAMPQVKMVEIKLAQGAKPGQGGLLPKEKITAEIAAIRGIPMGEDCQSPNGLEECRDVVSLLDFIGRVRSLTGKPVGIKLVVGSVAEIWDLCGEITMRGYGPDFIVIDGAEGGTGAGPLSLADHVGMPVMDGLIAVDDALRQWGLREQIAVIVSGKIATGGEAALHLAMGADLIHIGRGFLLSIGCIQALRCHTNTCPAGVTTQNRWLQAGLDPADKGARVANYSLALERDILAITHACGLTDPRELDRSVLRRLPVAAQRLDRRDPQGATRGHDTRQERDQHDDPEALGQRQTNGQPRGRISA
jgi:glutamate synthase domain-containing protein 2